MVIRGAATPEGILGRVQQAIALSALDQPIGQHLVEQLADYMQSDAPIVAHAAGLPSFIEVLNDYYTEHACMLLIRTWVALRLAQTTECTPD
jgi:hypothetical protein